MDAIDIELLRVAARTNLMLSDWREVESVGLAAMALGHESDVEVAMASVGRADSREELLALTRAAIAGRGLDYPDLQASMLIVAVQIAADVVSGARDPHAGARLIAGLRYLDQPTGMQTDKTGIDRRLSEFSHLIDDWDDLPQFRPVMAREVLEAAAQLLRDESAK